MTEDKVYGPSISLRRFFFGWFLGKIGAPWSMITKSDHAEAHGFMCGIGFARCHVRLFGIKKWHFMWFAGGRYITTKKVFTDDDGQRACIWSWRKFAILNGDYLKKI